MDLSEEKEPGSTPDSSSKECLRSEQREEAAKICADCRTTETPLWRGGPSGPKSLCNACGIRYRKRRRAVVRLDSGKIEQGRKEDKKKKNARSSNFDSIKKLKVLGFRRSSDGSRDVLAREWCSSLRRKQHRLHRKLREEEQAAFLLMALSSGFLYN